MRHRMTARISALVAGLLVGTTLATGAAAQERLGQVQFNVSCTAEAQQKFNRAMALYHSFGFKPATQAFTEIAQLDPKCGPMNSTILPSGPSVPDPGSSFARLRPAGPARRGAGRRRG